MDTWTVAQFAMMRLGGNEKQKKFFDKYGVAKSTPAREKYNTDVAVAVAQELIGSGGDGEDGHRGEEHQGDGRSPSPEEAHLFASTLTTGPNTRHSLRFFSR